MASIDSKKIYGSFSEQIDPNISKDIENIYKKIDEYSEFEVMFFKDKSDQNRMNMEQYLRILEYLTFRGHKIKIQTENIKTLDISYTKKAGETYRITLNGIDTINKYVKMLHYRKNHIIFSVLAQLLDTDKNITIIKKTKERENVIDIDDFNVRFRLSSELPVDKKELNELREIDETERENIIFRYKQRVSLKVFNDKDSIISLDLTDIKMANNINNIENMVSSYELEIDLSSKIKNLDKKHLETIYKEVNILQKIIQQSNYIISSSLQSEVIANYVNLMGIHKEVVTSLEGRQPVSLEIQHVVDQLPNKYCVTDKADGERYVLAIYKNAVFLISNLLNVKSTGIILTDSNKKYNNSILDGELIFVQSHNRYIFMAFDCMFSGSTDVRQESSLMVRHKHIDDIIKACFVFKNQKFFDLKPYDGKFAVDDILKFYNNQIEDYMLNLNNDLAIEKQYPLIRRKYFIYVSGGQNNEIFKYSLLLWNKYTKDKSVNCPYILDGLIYQPLEQKYVSAKESKFLDYKWKPEEKNSIDFYVQYEKSRDTGKIVTLYDNSEDNEDILKGKPYRVLKLYVGKVIGGSERPVLFEPETDSVKYLAYMFLIDGEVRDLSGNMIQDNTVVEFYYNNSSSVPDKQRWVPIKTRHDKTESVQRYRKKYGNYSDIAYKVWRSIRNPFIMNDIEILSKDNVYTRHMDILRGKIDHSIILSERKENEHEREKRNLAKSMRQFHNWLNSILIYTFINSKYEIDGKKLSVLDIKCGKGDELMKYYYGEIDFAVNLDVDNNNLISPIDGAISRYNKFKSGKPNFPRMFFVHADSGVLLNYEDQNKTLGGMSQKNQHLIEQFFSKDDKKRTKFDRVNCQKYISTFLENDTVFSNFTQNVTDYLKDTGYLIAVSLDADQILKYLGDKEQYTQYFTDNNGERKVLFEIIKKFDGIKIGDEVGIGAPVDFHYIVEHREGEYSPEYLVQKRFIEREFKERCNLELVETDLFENQYLIHKNFFVNGIYKYESNEDTRKFFANTAEFFTDKTEVNNACLQLTKLYRYYVFRKSNANIASTASKKKQVKPKTKIQTQKGGKRDMNANMRVKPTDYAFNEATDLFDPTKFIMRDVNELDSNEYSFLSSIHDILKTNKIIPHNVSFNEFYDDIAYNIFNDTDINNQKIMTLSKTLSIKHDYSASELSSEVALNGLNILIVKRSCEGSVVEKYGPNGRLNKNYQSSIIYFDGDKYYPIYKVKHNEYNGLFDTHDDFIKELVKKRQ